MQMIGNSIDGVVKPLRMGHIPALVETQSSD